MRALENASRFTPYLTRICGQVPEDLFGFGANAKIGVRLREENRTVARDDIGGGKDELPALVSVDEGQINQHVAIVLLMIGRDGIGETILL